MRYLNDPEGRRLPVARSTRRPAESSRRSRLSSRCIALRGEWRVRAAGENAKRLGSQVAAFSRFRMWRGDDPGGDE
jgi:hypothetical protein